MADLKRFSNRKVSLVIDSNDKIWAKTDRKSSYHLTNRADRRKSSSPSTGGLDNPNFVKDEDEHVELHLGHSKDIRKKSISYLKKELQIDYHEVDIGALYNRFNSDPDKGLNSNMVIENLRKYGKNELTPPKKEPTWLKFIKTLLGGFQLLLWTGSFLSFAAFAAQSTILSNPPPDNLYLGVVLAFVVVVLGLFTFYQEYSSGKIMDSFSKLVPSYAVVKRNGKLENINAVELVVGDIVEVKFGDRIPADIRIIEAHGFKVDNSSITGESEPQSRSAECTDDNPMESKNLAFFSTNALEGTCRAIVVGVGDNTFIGRIAGLASGLDSLDTPLAREVSHFVKIISGVAVFFGASFFIISLSIGYDWVDAALFLIGIIVANVPEGLLVTFTVVLALTAKKMAGRNCLVKQLHAVETLGSTTVICSDKTGTLTQNKMTVSHMWFNNQIISTLENFNYKRSDAGFFNLGRVATLCSRAQFLPDQESVPIAERKVNGDASESAIIRAMEQNFGKVEEFQKGNKKLFEIPFNSSNKYQVSIHSTDSSSDDRYLLVMKGAPERIIKYCKKILIGDKEEDLDDDWLYNFNETCEQIAEMGERVIGFCDFLLPSDKYPRGHVFDPEDTSFLSLGLRFVGLVSMIDPPRLGVPEAVESCRNAGIKVVMVTGDHPITAKAIAKSVGIISQGNETVEEVAKRMKCDPFEVNPDTITACVVNGQALMEMASGHLDDILANHTEIVFARVSPQQKLIIVEAFQRLNNIVAVTGDGVNDSPALKKADIGIAMGISGSDVSKQAADMILLDDNFISIVSGVEEGRLIFDNLKKCICYLLAANIVELTPFLIFIILRIPLPMGTIPMLMICLGTDIVPTISLSYEKAEGDIMKRKPRDPINDNLVTGRLVFYSYGQLGIIESFASFFTYFVIMGQNGFLPDILIGLAGKWDSQAVTDLTDSYGQEWNYAQRKRLEHTCWTGFFFSCVICQWGNVLVCKMRRASVVTKIFSNWVVYAAMLFETSLACFLSYTPVLNESISYMPLKFVWLLPPLPFTFLLIFYDETRRFIIRTFNWKWFQREFYY